MVEVRKETTVTVDGIELEKFFLKELGRLAWEWHKQKNGAHNGQDQRRARGMNGSVSDDERRG